MALRDTPSNYAEGRRHARDEHALTLRHRQNRTRRPALMVLPGTIVMLSGSPRW